MLRNIFQKNITSYTNVPAYIRFDDLSMRNHVRGYRKENEIFALDLTSYINTFKYSYFFFLLKITMLIAHVDLQSVKKTLSSSVRQNGNGKILDRLSEYI